MRNTAKLMLLFCLMFVPHVLRAAENGEKKKPKNCEAIFDQAQHDLRNNFFAKADKEFDVFIDCAPDDPRGYEGKVANRYFGKRTEQKNNEVRLDEDFYAETMELIATGIARAEEHMELYKDADPKVFEFNQFLKERLLSFQGLLQYANKRKWSSRDSGVELKELCERSKYQDSKYLLGVLMYELSKERFWKRAGAQFLGLPNGDRKKALQLIREAADGNDGPYADDIWILMLKITTDEKMGEKDRMQAREILGHSPEEIYTRLVQKYPHHELVMWYGASRTPR